jgi:O-antigen/teichoic acid export membrane protein
MSHHMLRLGRQTLVYGLSTAAAPLFALFTLPVVARHLTTAQYGVLELATTAIAVALAIVELGLTSASQRSFFDYSGEQSEERRVVLSTALVAYLASTLLTSAILILARKPLSDFLFNNPHEDRLIVIVAITLPTMALVNFSREVMRLYFRVWHYLASSLVAALVATAYVLFALLVLHEKVAAVLLSLVIGSGLAAIYGMFVIRGQVGHRFSRPELRTMLDYGLPLVPMAVALWALALIDRIMLSKLSSLSEVGEYAMANRLGLLLTLAATAFATAFSPFMLSLYAEDPEEEKQIRARALIYMSVAFALVTVLVALFARDAFKVIAPRFDSAYEAVGLVAFGLAVNGVASIAVGGISLARRTRSLVALAGVAAGINVLLNIILIPPWGMLGAAFATAVAYTVLFALYYFQAQRVYRTPYQLSRLIRLALLTAAATAVGAIPIEPLSLSLIIKSLVVVLFLLGLRLAGIVRSDEIAAVRSIVQAWLTSLKRLAPGIQSG